MRKTVAFPSVRTTPELKERVHEACEQIGVNFSLVVNNLLEQWVTGRAHLDLELDADFVTEAREALESPDVKTLMDQVGRHHKAQKFPEAIEI